MAILEHEVRSAAESRVTGLRRHLFTRDEYYALADDGSFRDKRVELIEGEIIDMAPIGDPHAAVTHPLAVMLERAFGAGFTVRNQVPIKLDEEARPSDPQPDITVVTGSWRDYVSRKPGPADIKLIVEIADSSLAYDRNIKSALYATAEIPEYWIVNLVDGNVSVYREPIDAGYRSITTYYPSQSVAPLFAPGANIPVAEILP